MSTGNKLELLLKWFDDNNVKWDKEALEIKETNGSFGVYAKKPLKKDKAVVKIPKESILSIKTTGIANILDEASLEGGCPLALAVLYEIAQKEQSPWYGYLQALPEHGEDLPIFWSEEEKDWFKGTEMESAVRNDLNDLGEDYHRLILPVLEEHPYVFVRGEDLENDFYSFDKFVKISTLISSRAFEVDAYHESALVPFADIFNHTGENEHVHFETEFEVCDACGALEYCEHQYVDFLEDDNSEEEEEEGEEEKGEEEVDDEEEIDKEEAEEEEDDDDSEEEKDTELPDLEALEDAGVDIYRKDDDEDSEEEEKKDTCDMVLDCNVKKGEEVFNIYGDHPNISLLSKYGFCYDDNKNDFVSIDENALVDCCLTMTAEFFKDNMPDASEEELHKLAIEYIRPRWEFFLANEKTLCSEEDDEGNQDDLRDDYEDDEDDDGCQDDCCAGGDHDHQHSHGHEHSEDGGCCGDDKMHEHEHDEDGGCCGDDDMHEHGHDEDGGCCGDDDMHEHDEEGGCCGGDDHEEGKSRPYYINHEGLFEDKVMCLLYILFVDEAKFETFVQDTQNALSYFEELAKIQGKPKSKDMIDTKRKVYQACLSLAEIRRLEYLEENGEWKSIEQEIKEREETSENKRKYYALTCRIGEKKIIEKSIKYYEDLAKEYSEANKKKNTNKHKKIKL